MAILLQILGIKSIFSATDDDILRIQNVNNLLYSRPRAKARATAYVLYKVINASTVIIEHIRCNILAYVMCMYTYLFVSFDSAIIIITMIP